MLLPLLVRMSSRLTGRPLRRPWRRVWGGIVCLPALDPISDDVSRTKESYQWSGRTSFCSPLSVAACLSPPDSCCVPLGPAGPGPTVGPAMLFVSLARALPFPAPPPLPANGRAFLEPELLRLLSRLLLRVLLTPSIPPLGPSLDLPLLERPCACMSAIAATLFAATVDFPSPGVEGAPGLSSCASISHQRRPSDKSNGLSFSSPVFTESVSPSDGGAVDCKLLDKSTTRS
ncbi:hypothetical protein GGS26DRAFT_305728 [Hypomontagnella submonticulosa]|nr:hypothetical protein GGS26DRAFT_305728 [Hypomontagnella submonticulosa]